MSITFTRKPYDYKLSYEQNQNAEPVTKTIADGSVLYCNKETRSIMSDEWGSFPFVHFIDAKGYLSSQEIENSDTITVDVNQDAYTRYYNAQYQCALSKIIETMEKDAATINKGDTAHVYKGRSGKGTIGKVVVVIDAFYPISPWKSIPCQKLAIATSDRMGPVVAKNGKTYNNYLDIVWAYDRNCEKINIPAIDMDAVRTEAARVALHAVDSLRSSVKSHAEQAAKYGRRYGTGIPVNTSQKAA